ncbi:hypothetical protein ACPCK1_02755 [Streptomyces pseudogriseolus]|uniref:hypothetical protein n=1 Tax=Streptomyces pseudogriseolus TaxID=36817 RepID=UPI003FA20BE6
MSQLLADAIDTLFTLGWSGFGWIAAFAAVATAAVLTTVAAGIWAIGATRRAIRTRRHP